MPHSHLSVEQAEALEKLVRKVQKKRDKKAKLEKDLKRVKQELKEAENQLAEASGDLAPVFRRLLFAKDAKPGSPAPPSRPVMLRREILVKVAGFGQRGFHADDVPKWFAKDFGQAEVAAAVEASLNRGLLERDERGFLRITESGVEELAG